MNDWQTAVRRWANAGVARLPRPVARASARTLAWLRRFLLGPHVLAVAVETPQGLFLVNPEDDQVGATLRWGQTWAPELLEALLQGVGPDSEVLVVGAHVGSLLLPLARRSARVTGVEAHPTTFRLLQANVLLNGLTNVELHHLAAGSRDGHARFLDDRADPSHSRLAAMGDLEVPLRRLDGLFEGRRYDVVVVDVEGAEPEVLEGMTGLLSGSPRLAVEVHPSNHDHPLRAFDRMAELLEPHYDRCRFVPYRPLPGAPTSWRPRGEFRALLRELVAGGFAGDALFVR